uniref:DUF4430 domain-containing protein n=1 Tax=Neogobius melanostomus TaxID=47308 RepID=A0A8C6S8V0_9GOBI
MYIYGFSSIIFKLHKSLLLTLFCFLAPHSAQTNITIVVTNSLTGGPKRMYSTYTVYRVFNILHTHNIYVNGLAGNFAERTYWQLKVKKPNGVVIIPNVGIGCYIPTTNDEIIFNFTSY